MGGRKLILPTCPTLRSSSRGEEDQKLINDRSTESCIGPKKGPRQQHNALLLG